MQSTTITKHNVPSKPTSSHHPICLANPPFTRLTCNLSSSNSNSPSHRHHHLDMDENNEASDKTSSSSSLHKRRNGKRSGPHPLQQDATGGGTAAGAPCGACKFLRRKCMSGCIFAPHFGSEQGTARFAAVHKVFGASNVSKLLLHLPASQRHDAVVTISYEAQARLSDPVYGCVSTILALQQQVASLQAELSIVQSQLISSRLAVANALQNSHQQQHQQQQQLQHLAVLQPAYSNNSSASNNLIKMGGFPSSFDPASESALSSRCFKPLQLSGPSPDDDEDEEDSRNPDYFNNQVLQGK